MPPPRSASRAARRAARPGPPRDAAALRAAIAAARLPGHPPEVVAQGRDLLLGWLDPARPFAALVRDMASGAAARAIALALLERLPEPEGLACAPGCAFCCILPGEDGGTVTDAEAAALYKALVPLRGQPDGRAWTPLACPALDPDTHLCRAYEARPVICRTYVSRDVAACEAIARGEARPGTGTLAPQLAHVTVHALARAALAGTARVPTRSLARTAAAALDGLDADAALHAARHPPASLDAERRRLAKGLARSR